jgi:hypothetical protein
VLAAGLDAQGAGLLINSSRGIMYAEGGSPEGIRSATLALHGAINAGRKTLERAMTRTVARIP